MHNHCCNTIRVLLAASFALAIISLMSSLNQGKSLSRYYQLIQDNPFPFADPKSVEVWKERMKEQTNKCNFHPCLIHVMSPFRDQKSTGTGFSPLGLEQWSMLASVQIAREAFGRRKQDKDNSSLFDEVVVVCAILKLDVNALTGILSPYCDYVVPLPRSTATEYPQVTTKELPFLQDIIDAGISTVITDRQDSHEKVEKEENFYVMLTNVDICLTPDFYTNAEKILREKNANAISINRMTIKMDNVEVPIMTEETTTLDMKHDSANKLLGQAKNAYENNKFNKHPGSDCFIIHSSVLKMIQLGDMFLGYPPWGRNLWLSLDIMGTNFESIQAFKGGTFHFGDDMAWLPENTSKPTVDMSFWIKFGLLLEYLPWCPITDYAPQEAIALQQVINCGRWFRPKESNDKVPAFVQPGHEHVYLNFFSKYLSYDGQGMPVLPGRRNPKDKMAWIREYSSEMV